MHRRMAMMHCSCMVWPHSKSKLDFNALRQLVSVFSKCWSVPNVLALLIWQWEYRNRRPRAERPVDMQRDGPRCSAIGEAITCGVPRRVAPLPATALWWEPALSLVILLPLLPLLLFLFYFFYSFTSAHSFNIMPIFLVCNLAYHERCNSPDSLCTLNYTENSVFAHV